MSLIKTCFCSRLYSIWYDHNIGFGKKKFQHQNWCMIVARYWKLVSTDDTWFRSGTRILLQKWFESIVQCRDINWFVTRRHPPKQSSSDSIKVRGVRFDQNQLILKKSDMYQPSSIVNWSLRFFSVWVIKMA